MTERQTFGEIQNPGPRRIPPDGTPVECGPGMPGVPAGTPAVVRHQSPSGHTNEGLVWLELAERIQWSHGESESNGYWASPGQFTIPEAS